MLLSRVARKLRVTLLPPMSKVEAQLIDELRQNIRQLPPLSSENSKTDAESLWTQNRIDIRDKILRDDPRRFLNWEVIRNTMFVGNAAYVEREFESLRRSEQWQSHWKDAICDSNVGLPLRFPGYAASSGNLIHHAYHLSQFGDRTIESIKTFKTIVEFGGGYGSTCRLVRRLGFKGSYFIFDLPELSALQRFYLKMNGIEVADTCHDATEPDSVVCLSSQDDLAAALQAQKIDLFLANWSLSETPLCLRDQFLPIVSTAQNFLIGYQDSFGEVDNRQFFAGWTSRQANVAWREIQIEHLPANNYLIGTRTPQPK